MDPTEKGMSEDRPEPEANDHGENKQDESIGHEFFTQIVDPLAKRLSGWAEHMVVKRHPEPSSVLEDQQKHDAEDAEKRGQSAKNGKADCIVAVW